VRIALMMALIVLADSAGDIFLTRGMKQIGEISTLNPRALLAIARRVLCNRSFLTGVFFMAVTFFTFLAVLSLADLSFVFPAKSLVYVASPLGAKWLLKETISYERWGGIFLVCLGVILVSLS
jgi:drug/metabolite transporter (DMT)-like permease